MANQDLLDPRLSELLDDLKSAPMRSPQAAARGRSIFLGQAVSISSRGRHSRWNIFPRKENAYMNVIISLMVMAGLLFGGGATVAAAQDQLPNQPLYQLKLISEEANIWLAFTPEAKIERLMEQAQARIQEMRAVAEQGAVPPAELQLQAQERIEQALRIAAGLDDPALLAALEQIRDELRIQDRLMLQDGTCTDCEPILQQTRDMLRDQLHRVEDDLSNPRAFRERYMNQEQDRTNVGDCNPETPCDPAQSGNGEQNQNNYQYQEQEQNQNGSGEPGGPGSGTQDPGGSGTDTQEPGGSGGGGGDTAGTGGRP